MKRQRGLSSGALCAALIAASSAALLPGGAHAAAISVACDFTAIQNAVAAGGSYQFTDDCDLDFTAALTVSSGTAVILSANGNNVTFHGQDAHRIFRVDGTLTLNGIDLADGHAHHAGGAIWVTDTGNLTLNDDTLTRNSAGGLGTAGDYGVGGAIYSTGAVQINRSVLSYNAAGGGPGTFNAGVGGAIASLGPIPFFTGFGSGVGRLGISDSTIRDNTAGGGISGNSGLGFNIGLGGGVAYLQLSSTPQFSLANSQLNYNTAGGADSATAYGAGGGLFSVGSVNGTGVSINGNTAGSALTGLGLAGGAFTLGQFSLTNSEVLRNTAAANGATGLFGSGFNIAVGGGIVSAGLPTSNQVQAASNNKPVTINPNSLSANGNDANTSVTDAVLGLFTAPMQGLVKATGVGGSKPVIDAQAKAADTALKGAPAAEIASALFPNGGLTLTQTTLANNKAQSTFALGGGLFSIGGATLNQSTVNDNLAFGTGSDRGSPTAAAGGGIVEVGGLGIFGLGGLSLLNSTIAENTAKSSASGGPSAAIGGGIALLGVANVASTTVDRNVAKASGDVTVSPSVTSIGGNVFVAPTFTIGSTTLTTIFNTKNSIYANGKLGSNFAGGFNATATGRDVSGAVTSFGYNLIQYPDSPGLNGFTATGDLTGVAPKLGKLKNNGGPVIFPNGATGFASGPADPSIAGEEHIGPTQTEALLSGSPAIDKVPVTSCTDLSGSTPGNGAPLTVDQRNFLRPFPYPNGPCDIGAYEVSQSANTGSCSLAVVFFSGSDQFAARTGNSTNTLLSYVAFKGPAGAVTAVPLVPRAGVPTTLQCFVPVKPATGATAPSLATFDAQVVASQRAGFNKGDTLAISIVRIPSSRTQSVTITDLQTNAVVSYTSQYVQPQSFVIAGTQ